jgi:hypothetical protein
LEHVSVDGDEIKVQLDSDANGRFIGPAGAVLRAATGREFICNESGEAYVRFDEAEGGKGRIFLHPFFCK